MCYIFMKWDILYIACSQNCLIYLFCPHDWSFYFLIYICLHNLFFSSSYLNSHFLDRWRSTNVLFFIRYIILIFNVSRYKILSYQSYIRVWRVIITFTKSTEFKFWSLKKRVMYSCLWFRPTGHRVINAFN